MDDRHQQPSTTDEELARQSQAGSLSAFEELVYRYEGKVYRYIWHGCRNDADARDLTQTAFVTAFRKLTRYDDRRPFAPWLFTIARRKLIDHVRSARRETISEIPEIPDQRDPATAMVDQETAERIWRIARRALPDNLWDPLWLRYQEDMSVRDIAASLRCSQTRVKVCLYRARIKLASLLEPYRVGPRSLRQKSEKTVPATLEAC